MYYNHIQKLRNINDRVDIQKARGKKHENYA